MPGLILLPAASQPGVRRPPLQPGGLPAEAWQPGLAPPRAWSRERWQQASLAEVSGWALLAAALESALLAMPSQSALPPEE